MRRLILLHNQRPSRSSTVHIPDGDTRENSQDRVVSGGGSAAFVLADEVPPPLSAPINSDHPATSTAQTNSTLTTDSASNPPFIDSVQGVVSSRSLQEQRPIAPATNVQVPPTSNTSVQNRRRRRRSSSEPTEGESSSGIHRTTGAAEGNSRLAGNTERPVVASRRATQPSPKRPRLMSRDMRLDPDKSTSSFNGTRYHTNGSSVPTLQKGLSSSTSNGYPRSTNGSASYTNGSTPVTAKLSPSTYYGHDREEIARLLIQGLNDLGYHDAADKLVQESGYELESSSVAAFRHAILHGEWSEAEALLFGSQRSDEGGGVSISNDNSNQYSGLTLAEGVDKDVLRFRLRRQKYLELLEDRDHGGALMVLRQELTPLHQDVGQLHILSG
ncbi:hypothetical protein MMC13_002198 [Lambiella insularis]|nr:hypothetical protein [Lambiella insularis]